jgi:DUF2905 family protein
MRVRDDHVLRCLTYPVGGPGQAHTGGMDRNWGPTLIILGAAIVVVGLLVWSGALSWFGRLPGDLRLGSGNVRVYIPITSMLLASLVATLLLSLFRR